MTRELDEQWAGREHLHKMEVLWFLSLQVEFRAITSQLQATRDYAERRVLCAKANKVVAEAHEIAQHFRQRVENLEFVPRIRTESGAPRD